MSSRHLSARINEITNAMVSRYKDRTGWSILRSVNASSVTLDRQMRAACHEKAVMGPGNPHSVDVYYVSDLSPENGAGCSRRLGGTACKATVDKSFPTDRLRSPRTPNHHNAVCSILPVSVRTERNQDGILLASSTYPAKWMAESPSRLRSVPTQTGKIEQTAIVCSERCQHVKAAIPTCSTWKP